MSGRRLVSGAVVLQLALLASPAAPQTVPGRSFLIAAAGDIIPHDMLVSKGDAYLPGYGWDFSPMMEEIEPWISDADLAICHMEGTLSATNTGIAGYPRFVGPREMAAGIVSAGWDTCSTANNHSLDAGWDGIVSTLDVLEANGLGHTGTARSPEERMPAIYEVAGVKVGHLSFTYGTNGIPAPRDRPWAVNVIDADSILADASWARRQGAEFVIVSLHWGAENVVAPTSSQRSLAARLLESPDVDLILGHHAHVVQPIERIGEKYVVYGMGNHLSNQNLRWGPQYFGTEDGLLVRVRVSEKPDGRFVVDGIDITPTWVEFGTYRIFSAADVVRSGAANRVAAAASFARTVERAMGAGPDGVQVTPTPWPAVTCGSRRATIVGTPGDDLLTGTPDRDVIFGREGNDVIEGGEGNDLLCGGEGDDVLDGGPGRDILIGWTGDDALEGDEGDILLGGVGHDTCSYLTPLRYCEP